MSKNQRGHITPMLLMHHYRNTLPIIQNTDPITLGINTNLHPVHRRIALLVIGGIDENFIEDFVQAGRVGDFLLVDPFRDGVENEHGLSEWFRGADVGIGTEQNVFQLGLLLVRFFDGFAPLFGRCLVGFGGCVFDRERGSSLLEGAVGVELEGGFDHVDFGCHGYMCLVGCLDCRMN